MASYTLPQRGQEHKTLSGTTADTVTMPSRPGTGPVQVVNTGTTVLYARGDSTTAVAAASGTTIIPAGSWADIDVIDGATLSVVGNGNTYSVGVA